MPRHRLATQVTATIKAIKAAGESIARIDVRQDMVTIYLGNSDERGIDVKSDAAFEKEFYEGLRQPPARPRGKVA